MAKHRPGASRRPQNRPSSSPSQLEHPTTSVSRQRFALHAEILEDTHLGSGSGGAGVNALLARDRRGYPVLWASHLEGLLRSAATLLKRDAREIGRLFGAAGGERQALLFTSLYCTAESPPSSHIWRSTARASFTNRAPEAETLRAMEFVPAGTHFKGHVELPIADLSELERLLQEVEAVGQGRASGAGRVRFSLEQAPVVRREVPSADATRWRLHLRALDPVCIAATATPDNLVPTESYVPGRTLLGALTRWLLQEGEDEAARRLVSEDVCVSDGLPLPTSLQPTLAELAVLEILPAPLSLQSVKPEAPQGAMPWWAVADSAVTRVDAAARLASAARGQRSDGPAHKRPEADLYLARIPGGPWSTYRPTIRARLRSGRPDPNRQDPMLFAVEQLAERTEFVAELSGAPQALAPLLTALGPVLQGRRWLRIGRAGAPVEVVGVAAMAAPSVSPPAATSEGAYLTLTSDLLLRDDLLRWRTALPDREMLAKVPGWPSAAITVTRCHEEESAVNGFNGTARLWRTPATAIRRGSVYKIKGEGVAALALAAAQGQALGERVHEGLGRFRVDARLPGVANADGIDAGPAPPPHVVAPPRSARAAQPAQAVTAEQICCVTKEWRLAALAAKSTSEDRKPSLSQWHDLVAELEAAPPGDPGKAQRAAVIRNRQESNTAGARPWRHQDASYVLGELSKVPSARQPAYARMFVRWLRVQVRQPSQKGS